MGKTSLGNIFRRWQLSPVGFADEDDPYATLGAQDAAGEVLAEVRVGPDFKLTLNSASNWIADEFRAPD